MLQAALAHMHYLPEEPGAAGRDSDYWQMSQLLQYRAVRIGIHRRAARKLSTHGPQSLWGDWVGGFLS